MVNRRTVIRAAVAREDEPTGTRVMDDEPTDVREFSLGEVASRLHIHRVTLLRMEQRKAIPPARWRRKPSPHRVFNQIEIDHIKSVIDEKAAKLDAGRNYVTSAP